MPALEARKERSRDCEYVSGDLEGGVDGTVELEES